MSTVQERSGAQILPPVEDERATIPPWAAHQCADADQRRKQPIYAELAAQLQVMR